MVLQAAMRITDEQEYVSWSLPKGSTVVLTTNPSNGEYMVTESDNAQTSRYLTLKMKASVQDWAIWAEKAEVDPRAVNFLLKHPEIIEGTTLDKNNNEVKKSNLRQWTKFFDTVSYYTNLSDSWDKVFLIGQNSLPVEHLMLFHAFVEAKLDRLPLIEDLLKKEEKWTMDKLKEVIGTDDKKRLDISSILSRRLMNYALVNSDKFNKDMVNNYKIILESEYLQQDLVLLTLRKITSIKVFSKMLLESEKLEKKLLGQ